jgi:hypothetical protein
MQALALSALAIGALSPAPQAQAQATVTLSVDPLDPRPGESVTVSGDLRTTAPPAAATRSR